MLFLSIFCLFVTIGLEDLLGRLAQWQCFPCFSGRPVCHILSHRAHALVVCVHGTGSVDSICSIGHFASILHAVSLTSPWMLGTTV